MEAERNQLRQHVHSSRQNASRAETMVETSHRVKISDKKVATLCVENQGRESRQLWCCGVSSLRAGLGLRLMSIKNAVREVVNCLLSCLMHYVF